MKAACFALLAVTAMPAVVGHADTPPVRIVLVGDSTVCNYPAEKPDRGWGQFLEEKFRPGTVTVVNLAAAGRSTKTFIAEGRWAKALAEKPNYILIQFGHNDSHTPGRPESTDAATDYRDFLRRYADDTRKAGAIPLFVTPMVRRSFDDAGQLQDGLKPYAEAMQSVGTEKSVPVIDLHASSAALVQELGPGKCESMANQKGDVTHFNEAGARAMCNLVMRELPAVAAPLKALLKD